MKNEAVLLPAEVAKIAESVSVEKRNEVQTVLNQVFNGVAKMREQLETIVVVDENDKVNMKLANIVRLGVKQERLDGEKIFDQKRAEVQQQMISFKTEDALWLKAKQTMQILTKEIEGNARWKEETRIRFEAEQRELKVQERILQVSKFNPEIERIEFESMGDESFKLFLSGIEKQYNDRVEAERKIEAERIETERLNTLERERRIEIAPFAQFITENRDLRNMSENDYSGLLSNLQKAKQQYEAEQEKIRQENEKLRIEAEAKEKQMASERAKAEAERKAIEEQAQKAAAERAKLEAEIKAKADKEENDRKAKESAEKKAKNAPDKDKLIQLALQIEGLNLPEIKGAEAGKILADVSTLLTKVTMFIREKTQNL